nr:hypothetical protein [Tanacetum cinerariifolium]GEZ35901.1 hypothetical protein [Tanacetum cinerariifolium]
MLGPNLNGKAINESQCRASFIIHSEYASRNDASAAFTAEADLGNSAPSTDPHVLADQTKSVSEGLETVIAQPRTGKRVSSVARQIEEEEASSTIKLKDLAKIVLNVQPSFKDLDSPKDDPVIVVDDSDEDEEDEVHATTNVETEDTSVPKSSSPISFQIQELINQVLILQSQKHKLELEKNKVKDEAALLKAQPFFPNVGQLNELLTLQWELLVEFLSLPVQVASAQGGAYQERQGKDAISSKDAEEVCTKSDSDDETTHVLGSMVESSKKKDLKRFDFVTEDGEHVHLTKEQISARKKIEEEAKAKATKCEGEMRKEKLIDLLGPKVVNKYCNDKLQYDRYCDKMLNRRAKSKITNYDILTRKGPITLKYIEKMIQVKSFLSSKRVTYILERIDYLRTTEVEPGIDLDRPLSEQDPLDKRNDLANKKRKHDDDIHDLFQANKRLKSSVQF